MARPREKLPPGARDLLTAMAGNGLRESKAAEVLGVAPKDFRRIIRDNPDAKDLWEDCLSIERDKLLDALFNRAIEGDAKAAQFLLAARHGLSEKSPQDTTGGVSVVFNLPDSLPAEKYLEAIRPQVKAIEEPTT